MKYYRMNEIKGGGPQGAWVSAKEASRLKDKWRAEAIESLYNKISGRCIGYEVIPPDTMLKWISDEIGIYNVGNNNE